MLESGPEYTVSELETLTGINRRTIHFYVKEGVISAPDGAGGGARYGEGHLLRLQLTRELQKSHLKLSGIKEAMDRLSAGEMRAMVLKAGSAAKAWDKEALESWLEARVPGSFGGLGGNRSAPGPERGPAHARVKDPAAPGLPPEAAPWGRREETWQRIRVAEGFELLLRSDLAHLYQALVDEITVMTRRRQSAPKKDTGEMDED